jgi:DNA-binding NarL/FixJ family response regulator/tetratricopeptide (TPR) repeat protein
MRARYLPRAPPHLASWERDAGRTIAAVGRASSPAVVGRDRDLDRLAAAFADTTSGQPRVVLLGGEAGIGKTRLVEEFAARVAADGGLALVGGCLDLADGGLPLLPLAEAIRGLHRRVAANELDAILGPARPQLARIVPDLANAPGAAAGVSDEASLAPNRLFEIVLGMLGRAGAQRPTMLAFEDVHWIDRASRDLCTFLVHNLVGERVLMVLTYRTDDLEPGSPILAWLAELGRKPAVDRIDLGPLGRTDVERQLVGLLGTPPDRGRADDIWRRSDGNPYFVEELAATTIEAGSGPPPTLSGILTARLARLSDAARQLVLAMAIAGRPVHEDLIEDVSDLPTQQVRTALREAIDHRVVEPDPVSPGRVAFRHALLREAAAADLLAGERRALHERFAKALTTHPELADPTPAGAAGELAHHWEAAGRVALAFAASVRAGESAATLGAFAEAEARFLRALELMARLEDPPDASGRISLLRQAADAADLAGDMHRALRLAQSALELVDPKADPETAGLLHGRIGYFHWTLGDGEASLASHRRAVELVPGEPPSAASARALGGLGGALMGAGRYAESRTVSEEAIRHAVAAGAIAEEARARNMLGSDLVALGDIDGGLRELERSRAMAEEAGPPEMRVISHHNLAYNLAQAGRLSDAIDVARDGRVVARGLGLERRFGMDLAALGADVLLRLGRWDEADGLLSEGEALAPGSGSIYLAMVRGRLAALRGDAARARERLTAAVELAEGEMDPDLAAYLERGKSELALVERQPHAALDAARAGLTHAGGSHDPLTAPPLIWLGLRAAAEMADQARARRDDAAAAAARETGEPFHRAASDLAAPTGWAAAAPFLALADAEWSRVRGTPDADAWGRAAESLERVPDPPLTAYARYREAEAILRERGPRARAEAALRSAYQVVDALAALPLVREISALARHARVALEPRPDARPVTGSTGSIAKPPRDRRSLSARELEVLRLVAAGRSNGQIAEELFITRKTAGVHVTHILNKLGVSNRVEAALAAARLGLVDEG